MRNTFTDCANNGLFLFVQSVLIDCIQQNAAYSLLYEAVFELKEAGFKLDVTRVGPKLTQSMFV